MPVPLNLMQIGDEIKCPRCPNWHRLYIKYPDEPAFNAKSELYFDCPKRAGSFDAGRVGEPPRDESRWRRAFVAREAADAARRDG